MKVIVDTSVWSLALRRRNASSTTSHASELENLIIDNHVQMIGAVRQELLSGIKQGSQFKKLEISLRGFRDLSVTTADYVLAATFFSLNNVGLGSRCFLCSRMTRNNSHTSLRHSK